MLANNAVVGMGENVPVPLRTFPQCSNDRPHPGPVRPRRARPDHFVTSCGGREPLRLGIAVISSTEQIKDRIYVLLPRSNVMTLVSPLNALSGGVGCGQPDAP